MTLADFYEARKTGAYDRDDVVIWLDDTMDCPVDSHIVVGKANMRELDIRYFKGMAVFVYAEKYSEWLVETTEKIKRTADFLFVGLTAFGDDIGWKWSRELGDLPV